MNDIISPEATRKIQELKRQLDIDPQDFIDAILAPWVYAVQNGDYDLFRMWNYEKGDDWMVSQLKKLSQKWSVEDKACCPS